MKPHEQAKLILELRNRTSLPMLRCKQTLAECDWDIEAALKKLRDDRHKDGIGIIHRQEKLKKLFAEQSNRYVDVGEIPPYDPTEIPLEKPEMCNLHLVVEPTKEGWAKLVESVLKSKPNAIVFYPDLRAKGDPIPVQTQRRTSIKIDFDLLNDAQLLETLKRKNEIWMEALKKINEGNNELGSSD
jgi:hypothetical protein